MSPDPHPHRASESSFPRRSCFAVLGLSASATADEVTEAYRQLAATRHPDAGGHAEQFVALERAYRDCLRIVDQRPQFSARPSGSSYSPPVPGKPRQFRAGWHWLAILIVVTFLLGPSTNVVLTAAAVLTPLLLGGLVSQLSAGKSLFVGGTLLVAMGLGWLIAVYRIGWISYAFNAVSVSGRGLEPAVAWEKQFALVLAIAATALAVVMLAIGCVVALARERR